MKSFARATKLSNVGGRADYISSPSRQESIVAVSASVDWQPYHEYEMANQKTDKRNNEGREVMVMLPNEWALLSREELVRRVDKIAITAAGKETDMQWAVHWNKKHTNLHVHIIFSERQKEKNPGRWDRDVYLTDDGKVARTKAQRARDADGNIAPPVHRKGEEKGAFTAKDPKYKSKAWLQEVKQQLREQFASMGVVIEKPQLLHEYHEGKGKDAPVIQQKNMVIRENNKRLEVLASWGHDALKASKTLIGLLKQGKIPVLYLDGNKLRVTHFTTPAKAVALMEQTKGQMRPITQRENNPAPAPAHVEQPSRQEVATKPATGSTHVDPPRPAVSLDNLREAAREFFRETVAIFDTRKPLDPAVKKAPVDLQEAYASLQEATNRLLQLQAQLSNCRFWERDKKASIQTDIYSASQDCRESFDRVVSFGVSAYQDGVKVNGLTVDVDKLKGLVDWRVKDLQSEATHRARYARPDDAPYGSPERQNVAQGRFEALCMQVPPEQRTVAREVIIAAMSDVGDWDVFAAKNATEAVMRVTDRHIPQPEQQENVRGRKKTQERG